MGQRRLEISDIAVVQEVEIIKNPYQFLNLAQDSSPEQVRRSYIRLAKKYHPNLVHPKFDANNISELYNQKDIEPTNLPHPIAELTKIWQDPRTKPEKRRNILEGIRLMAHRRMVLLNRAYEEIKSRYAPTEWNKLFGYDFKKVFNEDEKEFNKVVTLEGEGKVTVYPNNLEYWVAGPYLEFDYGPDDDHPWIDWDYRHAIVLNHLFAHIEIEEGKKVNKILLEPLFNCFELDNEQSRDLIDMLSSSENTKSIMKRVGIPNEQEVKSKDGGDGWLKSLKFRRCINEILTLCPEPDWNDVGISWELKDNKLRLEDYSQTNFSEADYILFLTLAYGPLLN